eukprot:1465531-Amphidinium_carterae.1
MHHPDKAVKHKLEKNLPVLAISTRVTCGNQSSSISDSVHVTGQRAWRAYSVHSWQASDQSERRERMRHMAALNAAYQVGGPCKVEFSGSTA